MISKLEHASTKDKWSEARGQLEKENFNFSEIQLLQQQWVKYITDRMDRTNDSLEQIRQRILLELEKMFSNGNSFTLRDAVQTIEPLLDNNEIKNYDESYIQIAIICEAMYYETVQKAGQKYEEKTA